MDNVKLGGSGLEVSRLCFGSLTIGPLQANLPLEEGSRVLARAIELGVNFTDTAQLYRTYPYIRRAMELTGAYELYVSTKTYAYTREMAVAAVEEARRELGRDYIDLFMLHEQESVHTLRGHMDAMDYLMECKVKGIIRAVGVSMHHIAAVEGVRELGIYDVIHPIFNRRGIGIADGTIGEMERALEAAHGDGIGVFAMKALGGGNLFREAAHSLNFVLDKPYVDSIAVGMQTIAEVEANVRFFEERSFDKKSESVIMNRHRRLHIEDWCEGCGRCVEACPQRALSLGAGGIAEIANHGQCILCGYCSAECPVMAIKVI